MDPVGLIGSLIIGIIAGWIAEKVMKRDHGLLTNLIVGLIGGLIGHLIASVVPIDLDPNWLDNLLYATLGAIVLLFLLGLFRGRGRRL